jgi:hypothetical protein
VFSLKDSEVRLVHLVQLHFFTFLIQCYDVSYDLCTQMVFASFFTQISFVGDSCFIYAVCIYLRILVSNMISLLHDVCVV